MSLTKLSGGSRAIEIDADYLKRTLNMYRLARALDEAGGDSSKTDCTFGFEYEPSEHDASTLIATLIVPVGDALVIGADDDTLAEPDKSQSGIIFVLEQDDLGHWIVRDHYYRFNDDEITAMTTELACKVYLGVVDPG